MKLLILLTLCVAGLMAQPTFSNITVINGSIVGTPRTSAKIAFQTNVSAGAARVRWGLTTATYTYNVNYSGTTGTVHYRTLTGLPPNSTIYYQVCATAGSEACSAEQTFTASTVTAVQEPTPPTLFNATPPTVTGTVRTVGANCDDGATGLVARWNASSYGDAIEIPITTVCAGRYTLAAKTRTLDTQWITIRSSNHALLPPYGTRVSETDSANMPEMRHISPIVKEATTSVDCYAGRHIWNTGEANAFKLWRCGLQPLPAITGVSNADPMVVTFASAHGLSTGNYIYIKGVAGPTQANGDYCVTSTGSTTVSLKMLKDCALDVPGNGTASGGGTAQRHVWEQVPFTAGTALPGTCTVGDWFHLTTAPTAKEGAYWCVATNTFQRVLLDSQDGGGAYNNGAVIDLASAGASGIRFIGLRFSTITIPTADMWHGYLPPITEGSLTTFSGPASPTSFTQWIAGSKAIVIDRCLFLPHRLARIASVTTAGSRSAPFAIVESIVGTNDAPLAMWRGAAIGAQPSDDSAPINIAPGVGAGGILIRNNEFNAIGIGTVFVQDGSAAAFHAAMMTQDVAIDGNDFAWPIAFNCLQSAAGQRCATGRHHIEFKVCLRCAVRGNRISNSWTGPNRGEAIALANRFGDTSLSGEVSCTSGTCSCTYNSVFLHCNSRPVGEKLHINGGIYTITSSGTNTFDVTPTITYSGLGMYSLSRPSQQDTIVTDNVVTNVSGAHYFIGVEGASSLLRTKFERNIFTPTKNAFGLCIRESGGTCNNRGALATTYAECNIGTPPSMQSCWGGGSVLNGTDDYQSIGESYLTIGYEPVRKYDQTYSTGIFSGGTVESGNVYTGNTISGNTTIYYDFITANNTLLANYYPTTLYSSTGNLYALPAAATGTLPASNTTYRTDINGALPRTADFNRVIGTYGAFGAQVAAMAPARGLTQNISVDTSVAGQITARWYAPTTSACTVQVGATRVAASAGSRTQSATVTGLSPGAQAVTVMCARQDSVVARAN